MEESLVLHKDSYSMNNGFDCFETPHGSHAAKHPHTIILTSGTTTISDQSTANADVIFAGTSFNDAPTLEFIGGTDKLYNYSVDSILAENGNIHLNFNDRLTVTNGVDVVGGELYIYDVYSSTTLGGNSLIDLNGNLSDFGGGAPGGGAVILNGNITVGSLGTNKLGLPSVGGNGTILQTGSKDSTSIAGGVGSGVHLDIRSGTLGIGSSFGHVDGTIGPANGRGPSLGPTASFNFSLGGQNGLDIRSAAFDTSAGTLSLIFANGQPFFNTLHFSGDARGLNISANSGGVTITDHPGSTSPIPISFT